MRTPHKHAELIKAWADGAEIEFYDTRFNEHRWKLTGPFPYWQPEVQFRIKPDPRPDVVFYARILLPYFDAPPRVDGLCMVQGTLDNLKFVFDGQTGQLKSAEVL